MAVGDPISPLDVAKISDKEFRAAFGSALWNAGKTTVVPAAQNGLEIGAKIFADVGDALGIPPDSPLQFT